MYHITNEKGDYFLWNDFNGKASFLPPEPNGEPPCTAFKNSMYGVQRKIGYLKNCTTHPNNLDKKGMCQNKFAELNIVKAKE